MFRQLMKSCLRDKFARVTFAALCSVAAVLCAVYPASAVPVQPGNPTHSYLLDEGTGTNTADGSGSSDGTFVGGPTWTSDTPFSYAGNNAVDFAGSPDGISIPNTFPTGGSPWNNYSISMWLKTESVAVVANIFMGNWTQFAGEPGNFVLRQVGSNNIQAIVYNSTSLQNATAPGLTLSTGVWQHFGFIYHDDNTSVDVCLDGSCVNFVTAIDPYAEAVTGPAIGLGGDFGYGGVIDEVAIWGDTALSTDNMEWLALNSLSDTPILTPTIFTWNETGAGQWSAISSWTPSGGPPDNVNHTAVFGELVSGPTVAVIHDAVTVNRVEFDNAIHSYAISGLGSVNLDATTAQTPVTPTISVIGTHEFQADVNLHNNTTASIVSASSLEFVNRLKLNNNTLTKTGEGTLIISNTLNTGGGAVNCAEGTCSGTGTIGGDLNNDGSTISPGNSSLWTQTQVPEPAALLLLVIGSALVLLRRR